MSENSEKLLAKLRKDREEITAIQELWGDIYPEFNIPDSRQVKVWLNQYDFDTVVHGLNVSLMQYNKKLQDSAESGEDAQAPWTRLEVIKYSSGCMKRKSQDEINKDNCCLLCKRENHKMCKGENCSCFICAMKQQKERAGRPRSRTPFEAEDI